MDISVVILTIIISIIGILVSYLIIKSAVRNAIIEAHNLIHADKRRSDEQDEIEYSAKILEKAEKEAMTSDSKPVSFNEKVFRK